MGKGNWDNKSGTTPKRPISNNGANNERQTSQYKSAIDGTINSINRTSNSQYKNNSKTSQKYNQRMNNGKNNYNPKTIEYHGKEYCLVKPFYQTFYFWIIIISIIIIICLVIALANKKTSNSLTEQSSDVSSSSQETTESILLDFIDLLPKANLTSYNYDEEGYSFYEYKSILRSEGKELGLKIKLINAEIIQIIPQGNITQYLTKTQDGNTYMLLIENNRLKEKLLTDDVLYLNGQLLTLYKYESKGGDTKEVPLIYINAYKLVDG